MNALALETEELELLREATAWRLIGLLLECPGEGWAEQIAALAELTDGADLEEAAHLAPGEASPGLYHTTFGPGGPASPREVTYRDTVHPGQFLAELRALYEAFAYTPASDEPPDHVSVEAGFAGYLRLKEAYARSCGNEDQAAVTVAAAGRFVDEHLALIAGPFCRSVENGSCRYLALAARALAARVATGDAGRREEPIPTRSVGTSEDPLGVDARNET